MAEKITPGPVNGNACIREAVCVHTTKVYDSCKSKECIRDLRVYLTAESQEFLDHGAVTVKPRQAELLCVCIDVEQVQFKHGFLCLQITYHPSFSSNYSINPQNLNKRAAHLGGSFSLKHGQRRKALCHTVYTAFFTAFLFTRRLIPHCFNHKPFLLLGQRNVRLHICDYLFLFRA